MRYLFAKYAFDTDRRELHRGADVVPVAPQVFDLLEYLIRNKERVVSKDELVKAIWNGRSVSDAALTTRLNAARTAIGDSGEQQRLIKTLPRKGFRFVGAVQEHDGRKAESVRSAAHSDDTTPMQATAPRLSIVVLPFANLSDDPGQDYFVDGVTENLTTDLSSIRGSFVIGRHTAFTYKGRAVDLKQIGRELNVRYVLEGSVQRNGNQLRLNARLVDAETASHLWSERFDKPVSDLFDMQDEIVSRLANTLNTELIVAEARRAERSPHPDTMDLYFQGMAWLNKGPTSEHLTQARGFFERALAIDPRNVEALLGIARVNASTGASVLTEDRIMCLTRAERTLGEVLSTAPHHAFAHAVLGLVQITTNRAVQGIAECELALALDRNLAHTHGFIGLAKIYIGRAAETEGHVREALRLSPRDIRAHLWLMFVGAANLHLGADAEALAWCRRGLEANRNHPLSHFQHAATLALIGHMNEAKAAMQGGLALDPGFTLGRFRVNVPSDNPAYRAGARRIYEGMRLAGAPEG